jgi:hypothetical protein
MKAEEDGSFAGRVSAEPPVSFHDKVEVEQHADA